MKNRDLGAALHKTGEDLRKIVVDYFPEDDAVASSRDLLEDPVFSNKY